MGFILLNANRYQIATTSREVARTAGELARISETLQAEAGKFRV